MSVQTSLGEAILDPELRHINFFNGRLLSGEDLTAEQAANLAEAHHLGRALGAGVAFGLEVSKSQDSPPSDVQVEVKAGLAVNAEGQVLRLRCDQIISLVRPPDPAVKADCVFSDCSPLPAGSTLSGAGFYLLTIAPASQREGMAPVNGLGNNLAFCNSQYFTEGVQFRLLPLNLSAIQNADRVRNEVAYQCFGIPGRNVQQFLTDAMAEADASDYGFEALVAGGRLTDQDVPLAVLQWNSNAGLGFVDRWAVRRRIFRPAAAGAWGHFTDYRRRAEAEAMFEQFQEELGEMQQDPGFDGSNLVAAQRFQFLPPAGLLPADFDWEIFFGAQARQPEVPLTPEQARALIWRSLAEEPVAVVAAANAQTPAIPFQIYRLSGQDGLILFVRSALNEIVAAEVYYDNSACCLEGVQTVQAALDALCGKENGCCTLVAKPGAGWELIFDQVKDGQAATICFPVGDYPVNGPVAVKGKGNLRLAGCGFGSRILAKKSEAALIFQKCARVEVEHFAVVGGVAGSGAVLANLNGALTFLDCDEVVVENACLQCAPAGQLSATCVTVRNQLSSKGDAAGEASLRGCELTIGGSQIGALFVNVARAHAEDNVLRVEGKPAVSQLGGRLFQGMKRQLISGFKALAFGDEIAAADAGKVTVTFNNQRVQFNTDPSLANAWQQAVTQLNPKGITDSQKLIDFIGSFADHVLTARGRVDGLSAETAASFANAIKPIISQRAAVASGGIWIAGSVAPEVRVLNNTIEGILAGIHIGLSHQEKQMLALVRKSSLDMAGFVSLSGNRISLSLPAAAYGRIQRHGIFVGNVLSLMIENNFITCDRDPKAKELNLEGIKIYGFIGGTSGFQGRVIIRANHLEGFVRRGDIGIRFHPLNNPEPDKEGDPQKPWIIAENLVNGAVSSAIQVDRGFDTYVRQTDNFS